jgi:DNA-binding NarL/FixJ family response regulator
VSATTEDHRYVPMGGPPVRVAVVDDDGGLVKALGLLFADEPSFRFVGGAFTVPDGLDLIARHQPDVVLVDVRMPAGGGVALTAEARQIAPNTVILAMSATDDPDARVEMAEAGAAGYVVKDVHMGELLHALDVAGHHWGGCGTGTPPGGPTQPPGAR